MSTVQILRNKDNLDALAKHAEDTAPEINDDDNDPVHMKVGRSDIYSVVIYLFHEGEGPNPVASIAYVIDQWQPNFHIHTKKTAILAVVADNIHRVIEKVKLREEKVTGKLGPNTDKVLGHIQLRSNFHNSLREFAREARRNPHKSKTVSFGLRVGGQATVTVKYDQSKRDDLCFDVTVPDETLGVRVVASLVQRERERVIIIPEMTLSSLESGLPSKRRELRALADATTFITDLNESLCNLFNTAEVEEEE